MVHIAAGLTARFGGAPVLPVDSEGVITIPQPYLAVMGLGGGGSIRMTAVQGGVMIEKA